MEMSHDTVQKRRESLFMEKSRDNDQKRYVYKNQNAAPKTFFNFHSQKQISSFSYQYIISFTHGLQHYCFFGQANLYRLYGLWQMSRQIWTILLVQKTIPTVWM